MAHLFFLLFLLMAFPISQYWENEKFISLAYINYSWVNMSIENVQLQKDLLFKAKILLSPMSRTLVAIYLLGNSVKVKDLLFLIEVYNYMSKMTMYNALSKLEQKGLLQIIRSDKNIRSIELTEAGKQIASNLVNALNNIRWENE